MSSHDIVDNFSSSKTDNPGLEKKELCSFRVFVVVLYSDPPHGSLAWHISRWLFNASAVRSTKDEILNSAVELVSRWVPSPCMLTLFDSARRWRKPDSSQGFVVNSRWWSSTSSSFNSSSFSCTPARCTSSLQSSPLANGYQVKQRCQCLYLILTFGIVVLGCVVPLSSSVTTLENENAWGFVYCAKFLSISGFNHAR